MFSGVLSGFIYYVALKGVTGAGNLDAASASAAIEAIRVHTDLPVAVGFGIKDAVSAAALAGAADGVVVGSALVQTVAEAVASGGGLEAAVEAAGSLLAGIRRGIDNTTS